MTHASGRGNEGCGGGSAERSLGSPQLSVPSKIPPLQISSKYNLAFLFLFALSQARSSMNNHSEFEKEETVGETC